MKIQASVSALPFGSCGPTGGRAPPSAHRFFSVSQTSVPEMALSSRLTVDVTGLHPASRYFIGTTFVYMLVPGLSCLSGTAADQPDRWEQQMAAGSPACNRGALRRREAAVSGSAPADTTDRRPGVSRTFGAEYLGPLVLLNGK
jgi:hypothetical protein